MGISRITAVASAAAAIGFLGACSDTTTAPPPMGAPSLAVGATEALATSVPELGKVKVCKDGPAGVTGSFSVQITTSGSPVTSSYTIPAGTCVTVGENFTTQTELASVSIVTENPDANLSGVTQQTITDFTLLGGTIVTSSVSGAANPTTAFSFNIYHGIQYVFTNTAPPPPICDFITFGRLVFTYNGTKYVISGNAGGFKANGDILGHINVQVGSTKYNVQNITDYVALPGTNVRFVRGFSGTDEIVLGLRDDPTPGSGEPGPAEGDAVLLAINGTVVGVWEPIDQGNIQLHSQCRGPGDPSVLE